MEILDVMWFSGHSTVGIVKVNDQYDGIKYYIGAAPFFEYAPHNENADMKWIADWGSTFPKSVGNVLFDDNRTFVSDLYCVIF